MRSPGPPSWQRARGAPPGPREPRPAPAAGAPAPPLPGPPSCAPTRRPWPARPRASAAPSTALTRLRGGSRSWPALAAPRAAATPDARGGQAPARPLLPAAAQAALRRPRRTTSRRALGPASECGRQTPCMRRLSRRMERGYASAGTCVVAQCTGHGSRALRTGQGAAYNSCAPVPPGGRLKEQAQAESTTRSSPRIHASHVYK